MDVSKFSNVIKLMLLMTLLMFLTSCKESGQRESGKVAKSKPVVKFGEYVVQGPYTHKNLSFFLISGEESLKGKKILTLDQAMEKKVLTVYETGNVNQLEVENISTTEYVFIQSGDIVKGGKQDRTLQHSVLIQPSSGKVKVASFCVEQGRWRKRGGEDVSTFSGSKNRVVSKGLKLATRNNKSQSEVWKEVSKYQKKMSKNVLNEEVSRESRRERVRSNRVVQRNDLNGLRAAGAEESPTSLQLSVEKKEIQEKTKEYQKAIAAMLPSMDSVVGYAFAINGEINSADVYANYDLFQQLWPKLLESSIMEAVVEYDSTKTIKAVTAQEVSDWLKSVEEGGSKKTESLSQTSEQNVLENEKDVMYESVYKGDKKKWVHKNYIKK